MKEQVYLNATKKKYCNPSTLRCQNMSIELEASRLAAKNNRRKPQYPGPELDRGVSMTRYSLYLCSSTSCHVSLLSVESKFHYLRLRTDMRFARKVSLNRIYKTHYW